jgi:hypothetical protein
LTAPPEKLGAISIALLNLEGNGTGIKNKKKGVFLSPKGERRYYLVSLRQMRNGEPGGSQIL